MYIYIHIYIFIYIYNYTYMCVYICVCEPGPPAMVWSPTLPSRTSSGQAPSLLPLYIHTLFPAGLLFYPTLWFYPTLCEWGHNTKAARTLSCFLLTAKKHVNLVRRSSTKPTPGKATPTHVTQSSALTWLLCTTYFPVYYTLVTTVELHLTLNSTYCSPIQHIIPKMIPYTIYPPMHYINPICCTYSLYSVHSAHLIYIHCTCPIYTVYIPYTYCVYIYIHICVYYI